MRGWKQRPGGPDLPSYSELDSYGRTTPDHPIRATANVLYVGGSSLIDRGGSAVVPLVDAIVEARRRGHELVVGVAGGIRTLHVHLIAEDLNLPTGLKALLAGGGDEQALRLMSSLLLPHGGCPMNRESPLNFPLYLEQGLIPLVIGSPLHHHWEPPARFEPHVDCGADYGLVNVAEVLAARSMIFLKDVDGVCTADPRMEPDAELIPRISVEELLEEGPKTQPLERAALEAFRAGHRLRELRVINGLKPEMLLAALEGEPVGTVIERQNGSSE